MREKKISSGEIEEAGITALKLFLHDSSISTERILSGDTYPSWDGELIVYDKQDSHRRRKVFLAEYPFKSNLRGKKQKRKKSLV